MAVTACRPEGEHKGLPTLFTSTKGTVEWACFKPIARNFKSIHSNMGTAWDLQYEIAGHRQETLAEKQAPAGLATPGQNQDKTTGSSDS